LPLRNPIIHDFLTFILEKSLERKKLREVVVWPVNPLNAELSPIFHLLALLGAQPILHVSRIRVNPPDHDQQRSSRCLLTVEPEATSAVEGS
jgi:hypothetical protein